MKTATISVLVAFIALPAVSNAALDAKCELGFLIVSEGDPATICFQVPISPDANGACSFSTSLDCTGSGSDDIEIDLDAANSNDEFGIRVRALTSALSWQIQWISSSTVECAASDSFALEPTSTIESSNFLHRSKISLRTPTMASTESTGAIYTPEQTAAFPSMATFTIGVTGTCRVVEDVTITTPSADTNDVTELLWTLTD